MFSGIGGFELGIQRALPAAECVGYSEIDSPAISTYERHFNHDNYGDATRLDPASIPGFGLLVGGFPCQAFSIAGKRHGLDDTRGTLFYDIARVLAVKRPAHFILENVKGLLSHDGGRTFRTILETFTELGYGVEWQVLNAKDFGLPQNRERVFLVGHLGGKPARQVFPFTGGSAVHLEPLRTSRSVSARIYAPELSPTLNPGAATGGPELPKIGYIRNRHGESVRYTARDIATCLDANYFKGLDYHGQRTGIGYVDGEELVIRRLTPLECERLQGFPDHWTAGASDTQRYKQLGNAVPTNLVHAVIGGLNV